MPTFTRADATASLLLTYVTETLQNLEPLCRYAAFGWRKDVPEGYNTLTFPNVVKFATSDIGAITEGVDPSVGSISTTAFTASLTQLGDIKAMSDLVVRNIAIDLLNEVVKNNQAAVIRAVDQYLQTVINANSNVLYAGGKTSRAALAAGDKMDVGLHIKAVTKMRNADEAGVTPINGEYVAITDPEVLGDLMANVGPSQWSDTARYTDPQNIISAKVAGWRGARFLETAVNQTFASTVTVHCVNYLGDKSFGWGYFQQPMPVLITTPDSSNPLALRTYVGVKLSLAAVLFQAYRIVRCEVAATEV